MRSAAVAEASTQIIDSPPIDGFVPWIVVTATNESVDAETTGIYEAFASSYVGSPPAGSHPRTDYFIAIFDTGASAHVIGNANAVRAGLFNSTYLTDNFVTVTGVTGSLDTYVSQPYGLFMAGLDVLEPNAPGESLMVLPSTSGLLGQFNVATLIGPTPGSNPDLFTAIGTPMSVFYDTRIEVNRVTTVTVHGVDYSSPAITFYEKEQAAPGYANYIPLELKPAGAVNVQYVTYGFDLDDLAEMFENPWGFEMDYSPLTPSVIMGNSSQSLFFLHGVDLTEGSRRADDRNRFMLDTGAQITVIGSRVAARLGLRPGDRSFEVEIEGVTGESILAPGFYLDSLTIPAVGDWLEFTNVPVILLDVFSPEGGTLDGIIGMNLFTEYNLMLRSGGFMLEDDPRLEFQRISAEPLAGDIAPAPGDNRVDLQDLSAFSRAWLADASSANWNPDADLAPTPGDGVVSMPDLMVIADNWLAGVMF
jgi:predicted aspartyl protease